MQTEYNQIVKNWWNKQRGNGNLDYLFKKYPQFEGSELLIYNAENSQPNEIKEGDNAPVNRGEVKEQTQLGGEWTKGKWLVKEWESKKIRSLFTIHAGGIRICDIDKSYWTGLGRKETAKANVLRIVTCVNGYDKLKADNEALISALKRILVYMKDDIHSQSGSFVDAAHLINTIESNKH